MDLIKKKSVGLTPETHSRLLKVVAQIQAKRGINTSANMAINVLIDMWDSKEQPDAEEKLFSYYFEQNKTE